MAFEKKLKYAACEFFAISAAAGLLSLSPILAQSEEKIPLLSGHVEHAEKLPELPPMLKPGAVYQKKKVEAAVTTDEWYRLPNCMAGSWEANERTDQNGMNLSDGSRIPDQTTPVHLIVVKGRQMDARGGIWDCQIKGSVRHTQLPGRTRDVISKDFRLLESEAESLLSRSTSTQIDVSNNTKRILQVIQVESIIRLRCNGRGILDGAASVKTFNVDGVPMFLSHQHIVYHRIREFERQDYSGSKDLRASFLSYLRARQLDDLIPQTENESETQQTRQPATRKAEDRSKSQRDSHSSADF